MPGPQCFADETDDPVNHRASSMKLMIPVSHFIGYSSNSVAHALLSSGTMVGELLCDHCERILAIKAYRVVSEDLAGGTLLNMLVCEPCRARTWTPNSRN